MSESKEKEGLLNLGNLRPAKGSNRPTKRRGRGIGSGTGKTAGRGHKGQHARKSGGVRFGFEGGQTPLYRRLPKRGFRNIFEKRWSIVNIGDLKRCSGDVINFNSLLGAGLIREKNLPVKLLGKGAFDRPMTIQVHACSKSAMSLVEKAGGKVELIQDPKSKSSATPRK